MAQKGIKAIVSGRVQMVGFRAFVSRNASALDLTGYVQNLDDGTVEVVAEGEKEKLEKLISFLWKGPRAANVENVKIEWTEPSGKYSWFFIKD
ncbi:MAG: acylphosphatase [Thermoplasmata archaeon]